MAAATQDRDGLHTAGAEQWYEVSAAATRIYRHTFVAVGPDGNLDRLRDEPGWNYVGVSRDAIFSQSRAGRVAGGRQCPVLQGGELTFYYGGGNGQAAVGCTAYALDDQTVVDEPSLTVKAYAVGRITRMLSGAQAGLCRMLINGPAALPGMHVEALPCFTVTVPAGGAKIVALDFSQRGHWPDGGFWLWCPPDSTAPPGVLVSAAVNGQDRGKCCLVVQVALDCGAYDRPTVAVRICPTMRGWGWSPGPDPAAEPVRQELDFTCAGGA